MRGSVDRASRMQPKRLDRAVNDHLYAAPSARDEVASIAEAAARMDRLGFAPAGMAAVAVRRSPGRATVTAAGCDLGAVDNRDLESVPIRGDRGPDRPVVAGLSDEHQATVWCYPPLLLACSVGGHEIQAVNADLADVAGRIEMVETLDGAGLVAASVLVVVGRGVLGVGATPLQALHRIEAAEALARLHCLHRGSDPGFGLIDAQVRSQERKEHG